MAKKSAPREVLLIRDMMLQLAHSSWILHINCNKRRVAPIAALISAVLHESLFSDLSMHEMDDNKPGPLKWVSVILF
ncbi:hypothetical protein B296_00051193 [Ensete ventricosum]|uniref:Uncharacterized protein n=1 Tax=Ensete ventricosum TaxID=4639 RepID=A0A426Y4X9_ENSVE|nr:hypothetical protein B296_00051193 [Ensete ventricosum]